MRLPLLGRCACGAVVLHLDPPTLFASYCHCETCRHTHAAPFVAWTAVRNEQLRVVEGEREVTAYASSPGVVRAFCRHCGTHVWYRGEAAPDRVYVPVAVLDAIDRPLDGHVSYEESPAWVRGLHELPCYREKGNQRLSWG